jgi:hypothetical protein
MVRKDGMEKKESEEVLRALSLSPLSFPHSHLPPQ